MSFGFISKQNIRNSIKGAENTPATSSYLGTVRADGTTILIDSVGTISVDFTSVNSSIANLSSVSATNIATVSSVSYTNFTTLSSNTNTNLNTLSSNTTSSIAYLSSVAATKATSSTFGIMRTDGTSLLAVAGLVIPASSSNGFGARTISTSAPVGGNPGDIWYQV